MRINKYLAQATGLSRRAADSAIEAGRVLHNNLPPTPGAQVTEGDQVRLDGQIVTPIVAVITVILNKPVGYVCSRKGQGSATIFELLPPSLQQLKSVGRLDKDSSGLLLMTTDGDLAQQLTHPSYQKQKVYRISLERQLKTADIDALSLGVQLEDGVSHLSVTSDATSSKHYLIIMHEGRNRQIRRTFAALGYQIVTLHRLQFGAYVLDDIPRGGYVVVSSTIAA